MSTWVAQEAIATARFHGSAQAAVDHIYSQTGGTGPVTEIEAALRGLIKRCPQDMLAVHAGTKLRDPNTGERFIMTQLGVVVQVDTGFLIEAHQLPYPLEIYRYARHR